MKRKLLITGLSFLGLVSAAAVAGWCCYPEMEADTAPALMSVSQEKHEARGFGTDSSRVDSQITLRIPSGQAGAVYAYLKDKYVGRDGILKDQFPDLHISGQKMSDVSNFTDVYYDTPALDLYRHRNSARHRTRENTTNPEDRKSGRELVQMKVTPPGQFSLRNELKFKVKERDKVKNADDIHPLIRLIDVDLRGNFKQVYVDAGINPYDLRHIFTIEQTRSRGYFNLDSKNILSFSVDEGSASMLWAKGTFSSVDIGLVEIAYTEGDEALRQTMWRIRDAILADLQQHFPELTQTTNSKYGIVLEQLMRQIPMIPALVRLGLL
jgi:hypothetical protein